MPSLGVSLVVGSPLCLFVLLVQAGGGAGFAAGSIWALQCYSGVDWHGNDFM